MTHTRVAIAAVALGLSLVACGSEAESSSPGGDAGASGGQPGSGGSAGSGGSPSGSGGVADLDSGPATVTPESLYMLAVGNQWSYDVVELASNPACFGGMHETRVVGTTTIEGREAFEVAFFCRDATLHVSVEDGELYQLEGDQWRMIMAAPVEEGRTWSYDGTFSLTLQYEGTVAVQAGTFDNCWRRVPTPPNRISTSVYCAGVGLVRFFGPTFEAELTAFSVR